MEKSYIRSGLLIGRLHFILQILIGLLSEIVSFITASLAHNAALIFYVFMSIEETDWRSPILAGLLLNEPKTQVIQKKETSNDANECKIAGVEWVSVHRHTFHNLQGKIKTILSITTHPISMWLFTYFSLTFHF